MNGGALGERMLGAALVVNFLIRDIRDNRAIPQSAVCVRRPRGEFQRKARVTELTTKAAPSIRTPKAAASVWLSDLMINDFNMNDPETGKPIAGVCHARGGNADLPPVWLIYVNVEDIEKSIARCIELGGQVIPGPKGFGGQGRCCVIRDPAGAALALVEPAI